MGVTTSFVRPLDLTMPLIFLIIMLFSIIMNIVCTTPNITTGELVVHKITRCIEHERRALLELKQGITDYDGVLASWGTITDDCCQWRGVGCSNRTGHVIKLQLRGRDYWTLECFGGVINSSLVGLRHLKVLDLSNNNFTKITPSIGSLVNLQYLNLSNSNYGIFPGNPILVHRLANLSNLQFLDLSATIAVTDNLKWLSNLSSLKYLDLSGLDLTKATHWLDEISPLFPSLVQLTMCSCNLPNINYTGTTRASLSFDQGTNYFNLSKSRLAVFDLSYNQFDAPSIYPWLLSNNFSSRSRLVRIDLSGNNLQGPIPEAFGEFTLLEHLGLSGTRLEGGIPRSFGNLSHLRSLDLSKNGLDGQLVTVFSNLSGCTQNSLEILNLEYNGFSGSLPDFTSFLSLQELHLYYNQLNGSFPESFGETSKLSILDVSANQITGSLPELSAFSDSLRELRLSGNRLTGSLQSIGHLTKLEILFASRNSFQGTVLIESVLTNLSRLWALDLSFNNISLKFSYDWIPPFQLNYLTLSSVMLGPSLPEWLRTQKSLHYLEISNAGISNVAPNWIWELTPNLYYLNLSSNRIEGMIPNLSSMSSKTNAGETFIDLSSNNFSGKIPHAPSNTEWLDLSNNNLSGPISFLCSLTLPALTYLDLSNNQLLSGKILQPPTNTILLDLSNDNFSGPISFLCPLTLPSLSYLDLSSNNFSGPISFLCSLTLPILNYLDLSSNQLSGELPDCWMNLKSLKYLNLENNKLTGRIPESIGSLVDGVMLTMRNNNLTGELPTSLRNCKELQLVDLGENKLIGEIPEWIGESMSSLRVFSLGSNRFHGTMPLSICRLPLLQILDLSVNKIQGTIPPCLKNLSAMGEIGYQESTISFNLGIFIYKDAYENIYDQGDYIYQGKALDMGYNLEVMLLWKGRQHDYKNTLGLVKILDLSSNNLMGEIPDEITNLVGLIALNLSRNNLTGPIPQNIGDLESLDFLDLSRNQLGGRIPASLDHISRLSILDVSYNNLSGRIPTSTQLQGYNASVYMGNPSLCGPTLTKKCPGSGGEASYPNNHVSDADDEDQLITREFYIGLVFGFGIGFWGVFGTMLLRGSCWRFLRTIQSSVLM